MKIEIQIDEIVESISFVSTAVLKSSNFKELNSVRFFIDENIAYLSATNGTCDIVAPCYFDGDSGVLDVLIDYKKFSSILSSLPRGGNVRLSFSEHFVSITSGRSRFRINTIKYEDGGYEPEGDNAASNAIKSGDLYNALSKAYSICPSDHPSYYLCGVRLDCRDGILNVMATDTKKMFWSSFSIGREFPACTIPKNTVHAVINILRPGPKGKEDFTYVTVNSRIATFSIGKFLVKTKLMNDSYPDIWALRNKIESTDGESISMSSSDFDSCMTRVRAVLSTVKEGKNTVEIKFGSDKFASVSINNGGETGYDEFNFKGDVPKRGSIMADCTLLKSVSSNLSGNLHMIIPPNINTPCTIYDDVNVNDVYYIAQSRH